MPASIDLLPRVASPLRIAFEGAPLEEAGAALRLHAPWLAGAVCEEIFTDAKPDERIGGIQLYRSGGLLIGHATEPFVAGELATRSQSLYQRILAACRSRHLFRIWNYVPHINELTGGLENYRAFCQGRSHAFEAGLGGDFQPRLPAASAVGSKGEQLDVIFVAGETAPRHFENPEQVPAYRYPAEHGPRAPSFARATVGRDDARTFTFISGTAAIKGHQTIASHSLPSQLDCTLHNLQLISHAAGLGENLSAGRATRRHFKIYLRHASDLAAARTRLEHSLLQPADVVTYLQADICRAPLNVEIEATLVG
jgi:hypothetical protein